MIGPSRQVHVWPVDDFVPHTGNLSCHCSPVAQLHRGGYLVTHQAVDGRDAAERATGRGTGKPWATTELVGDVIVGGTLTR